MKPAVARAALQAGASIVNDVARQPRRTTRCGERGGGDRRRLRLHAHAGHAADHAAGPGLRGCGARGRRRFSASGWNSLQAAAWPPSRWCWMRASASARRVEHNLQLLARAGRVLQSWQRPLLLGVSRKSFIGRAARARRWPRGCPASLACACLAVAAGRADHPDP